MAPLPPSVYWKPRARPTAFPLDQAGVRLYAHARHGLYHGVHALGLRTGDGVLVPAYHHGSEVEALLRRGLVPRFYEATPSLAPDRVELERLIEPRTRALHLTHYLGFPQNAPAWQQWCDEHDLYLIEDAAQSWLTSIEGRPVGSFGDLSVFCLYKSVGVGQGGLAICRADLPRPRRFGRRGIAGQARRQVGWLMGRSRLAARAGGRALRVRPYEPMVDFGLGDPDQAPVPGTMFLARRLADATVPARRQANYRYLLAALGDLVPSPFGEVPAGSSPFAFPVSVTNKTQLLAGLRRARIRHFDFWSVPHPALAAEFAGATERRSRTVLLPVHQELRRVDLDRIIGVVRTAVAPGAGMGS